MPTLGNIGICFSPEAVLQLFVERQKIQGNVFSVDSKTFFQNRNLRRQQVLTNRQKNVTFVIVFVRSFILVHSYVINHSIVIAFEFPGDPRQYLQLTNFGPSVPWSVRSFSDPSVGRSVRLFVGHVPIVSVVETTCSLSTSLAFPGCVWRKRGLQKASS